MHVGEIYHISESTRLVSTSTVTSDYVPNTPDPPNDFIYSDRSGFSLNNRSLSPDKYASSHMRSISPDTYRSASPTFQSKRGSLGIEECRDLALEREGEGEEEKVGSKDERARKGEKGS